jgi:hypothetical protein
MANNNDFKLLNAKCRSYFEILEKELGRSIQLRKEINKERFGFYLFMLESICDVKDPIDIANLVTDTEFNDCVFNSKEDDQGIDAVYIDDEQNIINIFNFKFREKFTAGKQQSINETLISMKFTNAIVSEKTNHLKGKLKKSATEIIRRLNSKDIWKIKLFVISNEDLELPPNSSEIQQLQSIYDLETVPIGLDTISKLMSIRPEPITAILHLDKHSIMPFTEDNLSSSKSYILKVTAPELIRITCDNKSYRSEYNIENSGVLCNVDMDYNVLFDNVRGLILRSRFNDNISATLRNEPSKFFMYNNGLTITASDIVAEDTNLNKKVRLKIVDLQVVNGGQTLRKLHAFNKTSTDNISKYLSNCEILVRVFKTTNNDVVKNKIAEYTNSQNAISNIDLKSLSSEQIQIEQYLDQHQIIYARKLGDTGIPEKKYLHKISMEKFGQILFSLRGYPEKASNQKKLIFDKYYDLVFGDSHFDITMSAANIKRYYDIKKVYDANEFGYKSTDQKVYYILYLDSFFDKNVSKEIHFLEKAISEFESDKAISEPRKLIKSKFKEFIDSKLVTNKSRKAQKGTISKTNKKKSTIRPQLIRG